MLKDEDRIFKNLYNDLGWDIDSAIKRGDWSQTKEIIQKLLKNEFPDHNAINKRKNNEPEKNRTTLLKEKNA